MSNKVTSYNHSKITNIDIETIPWIDKKGTASFLLPLPAVEDTKPKDDVNLQVLKPAHEKNQPTQH